MERHPDSCRSFQHPEDLTFMNEIPDIIIGRLPRYLRALTDLAENGVHTTSSKELGERLGISAAQIRKDLSQFGGFGKQGSGYKVLFLIRQLQQILKVDRVWDMALVGVGDLGRALARYQGFMDRGFRVAVLFDNDPSKIGTYIGGLVVQDVAGMVEKIIQAKIHVAMLTLPAEVAQQAADRLVKAGVRAILNYAPVELVVPPEVRVQYIDPVNFLQRMTYYLA
jgi:redox-sensing transcriptional repressor